MRRQELLGETIPHRSCWLRTDKGRDIGAKHWWSWQKQERLQGSFLLRLRPPGLWGSPLYFQRVARRLSAQCPPNLDDCVVFLALIPHIWWMEYQDRSTLSIYTMTATSHHFHHWRPGPSRRLLSPRQRPLNPAQGWPSFSLASSPHRSHHL